MNEIVEAAQSLVSLIYAMGGTVSAGRCNDELIDHLVDAEFIKSSAVQHVFRAVDRGNYYHPNHKQNAYKDIAWKMGNLHLSAPCVYAAVIEALKLKPGLTFLNLGSGSGYLSTVAGLALGRFGVNHGIEYHQDIVDYAYDRLDHFLKTSKAVDEFDFCEPVFLTGNCLTLDNTSHQYDRVYCGAACPEEYETYVKNLLKIHGILIMPLNDRLLKVVRVGENTWHTSKVLSVSFAPLIPPPAIKKGETIENLKISDIAPPDLKQICRSRIRSMLRQNIDIEHPDLKQIFKDSRPRRRVRRLVIPFFDESDISNGQSDSDIDYDSDSPEFTISSRMNRGVSVYLEDFLRRHHGGFSSLDPMDDDQQSSSSDSELDAKSMPNNSAQSHNSNEDDLGSSLISDLRRELSVSVNLMPFSEERQATIARAERNERQSTSSRAERNERRSTSSLIVLDEPESPNTQVVIDERRGTITRVARNEFPSTSSRAEQNERPSTSSRVERNKWPSTSSRVERNKRPSTSSRAERNKRQSTSALAERNEVPSTSSFFMDDQHNVHEVEFKIDRKLNTNTRGNKHRVHEVEHKLDEDVKNSKCNESDSNDSPAHSTRGKKKALLKRKLSASSSPERRPGTSSGGSSEPGRKILCGAGRVVFKNTNDVKKEVEKDDSKEETPRLNYTFYLLQKIDALPLPPSLLQYLNYERNKVKS